MINGSPKGHNSMTKKIISKALNSISSDKEIETTFIDLASLKINMCIGCLKCFESGKCSHDLNDDMRQIKRDMLGADLIIFASPIYAGNVTGIMKTFLDRLAYWMHLMCLCGKPVVIVTNSCGNGIYFIDMYLRSMIAFLGGNLLRMEHFTIYTEEEFNEIVTSEQFEGLAAEIVHAIESPVLDCETRAYADLQMVFKSMQKNIRVHESSQIFEFMYWKKNGLLDMETFQDVYAHANKITESFMGEI